MSYSQTRSSTSQSSRLRLGVNFSPAQKATVLLKKTTLTGFTDDQASGAKLTYRYQDDEGHSLSVFLSKDNEVYFYESVSGGLQYGFDLSASTKMTVGVGGSIKSYSLIERESVFQKTLSINVDQDLLDWLGVGLAYNKDINTGNGLQTQRYLRGSNINSSDIESYLDLLIADSFSAYIEFVFDRMTIGLNGSVDRYMTSSSRALSAEVYADVSLTRSLFLGGFVSRGKTDFSSTPTNSSGLTLSYRY